MLRRILIIFGYICFVLALVVFTVALVAYGKDYSYDFSAHKLIQNGHVIIDSLPNGVRLSADGHSLKKKTPYQAAYKVGDHTFSLDKDGFWPWQKVLRVVAGRVASAGYVILIPKQPVTAVLDSTPGIVAQAASKDHRHLAYITSGPNPAVVTLDLSNRKVVKLYVPKVATPAEPAETLRDVAWSDDASHLLIVSDVAGQPVHRLAAANGGETVNLTQVYGFNLTGLKFFGSNWRQMYWISPDGLRRLDVDAQTVSGVLADKVSQFWALQDRILYVQQTELGRSLWSIDNRGKKQEIIQALAESDSYEVAAARYSGEDELAVVPAKTQVATLYSNIYGDTPESKVIARGVSGASFSPDGHLLALTAGAAINMYDLERSEVDRSFVLYTIPAQSAKTMVMTWFDDHHILTNRDGELWLSEFDGDNSVDMGKAYATFPGYSALDAHYVVSYRPDPAGVKLTLLQIR
jgi:hypothetical protein